MSAAEVTVSTVEVPKVEASPDAPTTAPEVPKMDVVESSTAPVVEEAMEAGKDAAKSDDKPAPATSADKSASSPTKSPNILAKLFAPFKGSERKPKSTKKEKKKEEAKAEAVTDTAPTTEEAPKEAVAAEAEPAAAAADGTVEPPKESDATPADTSADAAAEPPKDEVKAVEEPKDATTPPISKATKVGRRLSARFVDFVKPKKENRDNVLKVPKEPPIIATPAPIAPLENPADHNAVSEETPGAADAPKPADVTPQIVAAAA